jgi:hypothetical protein
MRNLLKSATVRVWMCALMVVACVLFWLNESCFRAGILSIGWVNLISGVTSSYMASFIFFFVATVVEQHHSRIQARKLVDDSLVNLANGFVGFVEMLRKDTSYKPQIEIADNINFDENDSRFLIQRWVWKNFVDEGDRTNRATIRMYKHNAAAAIQDVGSNFTADYLVMEPYLNLLHRDVRFYLYRINRVIHCDWNIPEPSELWFAHFEEALNLYFMFSRAWLLDMHSDQTVKSETLKALLARVEKDRP